MGAVLLDQCSDPIDEGRFDLAHLATRRHQAVEVPVDLGRAPVDEVAERAHEVLVDRLGELGPRETRVVALGGVGEEVPTPVVRRQQFERVGHEHAAVVTRRELPAVVVQPVEALELVDEPPRLARPHQRGGEAEGVERDVVLRHELRVPDVVGATVGAPPRLPVAFALGGRLGPLPGRGDVADRSVEPDVEDLVLETGAVHGDTPVEVAGDAAVLEALVEPLEPDRRRKGRPLADLGLEPGPQALGELGLQQVEVPTLALFEVGRSRDRRPRVDEHRRLELAGAVLALVAARLLVPAVGTGALDVAVGQEASIGVGVDLPDDPLLDVALGVEALGQVLGELVVGDVRGAAEVVERQPEAGSEVALDLVVDPAELGDVEAGGTGGELGGRAVLVGCADEQDVLALEPEVPGVRVRGQHRSHEVAEVLHTVDVGQRRGDQVTGHGTQIVPGREPVPGSHLGRSSVGGRA